MRIRNVKKSRKDRNYPAHLSGGKRGDRRIDGLVFKNHQQEKAIDRELWEFAKTCKIPASYFQDGPDDEPLW